MGLEGAVELGGVFVVGDGDVGAGNLDGVVAGDVDGGQGLKDSREGERLAVEEVHAGDLGLGDGIDVLLLDGLAEAVGDEGLEDLLTDLLHETGLDDGLGHLADAEAGDAGDLLVALDDGLEGLGDFIGGHFDRDLADEGGVQGRAVVVAFVVVTGMIMVSVIVGVFELSGWRLVSQVVLFGGFSRGQCSAFQGDVLVLPHHRPPDPTPEASACGRSLDEG